MKKAVFFLLFVPMTLFAADYQIEQISFYPERIYIGDEVTCRVTVYKNPDTSLRPPESDRLPSGRHVRFISVNVLDEGRHAYIDIVFAAYNLGVFFLPDLHCGDFVLTGIKVNVLSVRNGGEVFSGIQPASVYRLKGLYFAAGVIAVLAAAVILAAVVFLPGAKMRLKKLSGRLFSHHPYKVFLAFCRNMEKTVDSTDSRRLYDEMTNHFRLYLTRRTGENFFIVMTRDFKARISEYLPDAAVCEKAAEILTFSDTVRFGTGTEGILREKKDLKEIKEIARRFEESFGKRGRK